MSALPGGSVNFCWRITSLPSSSAHTSSIVKHAASFIRTMPDISLSTERLDYEHVASTTMPNLHPPDEYIRLPQVHNYFPDDHVLYMSDGGARDLKESYRNNASIDILLLGERLGVWLASLHCATSYPYSTDSLQDVFGSEVAKTVFAYPYDGVAAVLKNQGFDPLLGERINARFGTEAEDERICVCHSDFWMANIQLEDQDATERMEAETKPRASVLTIIDWENVRCGNGATDAARFAANAWLHDRFFGDKGMCEAFLKAYLEERSLSRVGKIRLVVHFAVHIIFYSRMRWTDDAGTKELVRTAKEMLEAVEAENFEALKEGPLARLFGDSVIWDE